MADVLKLDREALRAQLAEDFDKALNAVANAVDGARDGAWIEDSEELSRLALDRLKQKIFEAALQAKVDAAEAAFPPSGQQRRAAPAS